MSREDIAKLIASALAALEKGQRRLPPHADHIFREYTRLCGDWSEEAPSAEIPLPAAPAKKGRRRR